MAKTVTLIAGVDKVPFDPFRTIKKIHWGGNWLVCVVDIRVNGLVVMNVDLVVPGQTIPFVVLDTVEGSFFPAPYEITAEGKSGRFLDPDDGPNTGFGVRNFPGTPLRGVVNGQLWFKLDNALPKTPFGVTYNYSSNSEEGSGDINLFYVGMVKGDPKTGGVLAGPDPVSFGNVVNDGQIISLKSAATETFDPERSFTFMVDPSTLEVSDPTG
jgi:hypothetical protein